MKPLKLKPLFIFVFLLSVLAWYLYRLADFPIFADEAIYLHWAKRVALGEENPFISMFDGKPPLFIWLSALASFIFPSLLFAGRLISVLSLFVAVAVIHKNLVKQSSSWAWAGTIFILSSPFIFFHGRLALLDMLFTALLSLAILAWSQNKLKHRGLISGIFLGLAFWTKTPALFFLPLPLLVSLVFEPKRKTLFQAGVAILTAGLIIAILKFSLWFPYLFLRSQDFSYTIRQVLSGQRSQIISNLKIMIDWLWFYLPWPVLLLALLGAYQGLRQRQPLVQTLFIAVILFLFPMLLFGKILASRYFLPLGTILPLLAAFSLKNIPSRRLLIILAAYISLTLPFNRLVQTQPLQAYLHPSDERQYLMEWSSGIGLKQVNEFIQQQTQQNSIKLLTEGYFGTLPDGLFVLRPKDLPWKNLEIIGVGSPGSPDFKHQLEISTADIVFYVGNQDRIPQANRETMQLIKQYPKKGNGAPLELYQVTSLSDE